MGHRSACTAPTTSPTRSARRCSTARLDLRRQRIPWISFKLPYSLGARWQPARGDVWARRVAHRLSKLDGPGLGRLPPRARGRRRHPGLDRHAGAARSDRACGRPQRGLHGHPHRLEPVLRREAVLPGRRCGPRTPRSTWSASTSTTSTASIAMARDHASARGSNAATSPSSSGSPRPTTWPGAWRRPATPTARRESSPRFVSTSTTACAGTAASPCPTSTPRSTASRPGASTGEKSAQFAATAPPHAHPLSDAASAVEALLGQLEAVGDQRLDRVGGAVHLERQLLALGGASSRRARSRLGSAARGAARSRPGPGRSHRSPARSASTSGRCGRCRRRRAWSAACRSRCRARRGSR